MNEELPTVTHTGTLDLAGYKLTVHTLSSGERVYEIDDELRRLFSDLGLAMDEGAGSALPEEG